MEGEKSEDIRKNMSYQERSDGGSYQAAALCLVAMFF